MNHRHNPLTWAFDAGNWLGVRVHISAYFPLLVFVLCVKLGWQIGGIVSAVLFLSVVFHEFGHIVANRSLGGSSQEILLWPFGGHASYDDLLPTKSQLLMALSGPLMNLIVCLLSLSDVLLPGPEWRAFNPFLTEIDKLSAGLLEEESTRSLPSQVMVLVFAINLMLLVVNLIPAKPLDGGRMMQLWLGTRIGPLVAAEVAPRFAFLASAVLILVSLVTGHVFLILLAFLLILVNLHDTTPRPHHDAMQEDSFLGYDFSEGYTSLERSSPTADAEPAAGGDDSFARRHQQRGNEKEPRPSMLTRHEEAAVDKILAKLHEQGMPSLTAAEKRLLKQASARYRERGRESSNS